MNKKKFLKILEEKLQILSEEERNDILNEYKDTIEEKVKHGSSEEEAVADFGSVEELSREILKAYKINPDYSKSKDKVKDFVEDGETLIKKGAEKLSEWTQDIVDGFKNNDQNWTLEMVFEVIIKAIILLIGLSLLRVPFYLIEALGLNIFEMAFPPFNSVFKVVLRCFTSFIYLIVCIIIVMIVFKPYFVTSKKSSKKKEVHTSKIEKENKEAAIAKKPRSFSVVVEIIKAFLFLCTVFPLYIADFGCYIALAVFVFLLVKGVPILGLFLMLLGITIFLTFLTRLFYNLLYGNKKIYCYSLIISAVIFVSGCFFSIETFTDFEIYQGLPNNSFLQKEFVYESSIKNESFHISYYDYEIKEDSSLEDNKIEFVVSYYSDFVLDVDMEEKNLDDTTFYKLKIIYKNVNKQNRKKVYDMVLTELKNLRWYHYSELRNLKIVVKANANTIGKLK
ncbi:MAG: DUF1700 domain-containing protein [Bacilli bacterium]|nr:DUF1700 domain-containing protein [Bacilli bacterium]